jgi:hypothetical protein
MIDVSTKQYNNWNSTSWCLPTQTGDLLLFPSYLAHMVEEISEEKEVRVSLSFNTFLKGQIGGNRGLKGLIL